MVPYSDRRSVVLKDVHNGSVLRGRENIIYGKVYDAETGDLLVAAALNDILKIADERGYNFVVEAK